MSLLNNDIDTLNEFFIEKEEEFIIRYQVILCTCTYILVYVCQIFMGLIQFYEKKFLVIFFQCENIPIENKLT